MDGYLDEIESAASESGTISSQLPQTVATAKSEKEDGTIGNSNQNGKQAEKHLYFFLCWTHQAVAWNSVSVSIQPQSRPKVIPDGNRISGSAYILTQRKCTS